MNCVFDVDGETNKGWKTDKECSTYCFDVNGETKTRLPYSLVPCQSKASNDKETSHLQVNFIALILRSTSCDTCCNLKV